MCFGTLKVISDTLIIRLKYSGGTLTLTLFYDFHLDISI